MVSNDMKKASTASVIRETQAKTIMRHYSIVTRLAEPKVLTAQTTVRWAVMGHPRVWGEHITVEDSSVVFIHAYVTHAAILKWIPHGN